MTSIGRATARRTGADLIAPAAVAVELWVHAKLAPDHLDEVPYIGALFVAASVLLAVVLVGLLLAPRSIAVWSAGALLAAGMAVAFVASRTVGLPDLHEAWTSDGGLGLVALGAELAYLGAAAAQFVRRSGQQ